MRKMRQAHKLNRLIDHFKLVMTMVALMLTGGMVSAMTVLSADRNTISKAGELRSYPCAVDIFFKGAMICINNAGFAAPAQDAVGFTKVIGVADENVDNSGGSAGDLNLRVRAGRSFQFATASIAASDLGRMMYVVDDQTFEDVEGTNAIPAGILTERDSNTVGWIYIDHPQIGVSPGAIRIDILAGQDEGSDNTYTLTEMRAQDRLIGVWHMSTAAAIATMVDVTGVFSTADGTLDGDGATDRTSDSVIVFWVKDGA